MTFQALATMTQSSSYDGFDSFDPSDEGEIARIEERSGNVEDTLSEYEQSFFAEVAELGIEPEFFNSDEAAN